MENIIISVDHYRRGRLYSGFF